jgi:hypothetical protein
MTWEPAFLADHYLTQSPVPPCAWRQVDTKNGRGADIADYPGWNGAAEMSLVQLA